MQQLRTDSSGQWPQSPQVRGLLSRWKYTIIGLVYAAILTAHELPTNLRAPVC